MADRKKRKYTKKSPYWEQRFGTSKGTQQKPPQQPTVGYEPELLGDAYYVSSASAPADNSFFSRASYSRSTQTDTSRTRHRANVSALVDTYDPYSAIRRGTLPYHHGGEGIDIRDTILLSQKAYANVAIYRNAIDIMSEFANAEVYLEGGSKKSRDFFKAWFDKINLINLKDQYFREYYRSGNIFIFRIDGEFTTSDFLKILNEMSNTTLDLENRVPVRYVLLNPYDIVAKKTTSFSANSGVYAKLLSEYEIARLKNPQNDIDRDILKGLPKKTQEEIKSGKYSKDGIFMELDPNKLSYSFYKKQDYEPFAIPFGYPVLSDINAKIELKKMDQAITRTVENVVLLITMGAEPDKGGVNANNLTAMQELFRNESVGRILVSDYTTKADFVIPDLKKVLGPEKYITLNEDIKAGLQNIIMGEEKYSSTQVKAEIFIDRLKEARSSFLSEFLQPEIERVAQTLGFRAFPQAKFKDLDMRDETQLMRVTTRLMELGILTPEQGMEMFNNGRFPDAEKLEEGHKDFVQQRKQGLYNPIVGGVPVIEPAGADKDRKLQEKSVEAGIQAKKQAAKVNKTNRVAGRPEGTTGIPLSETRSTVYEIENLQEFVSEYIRKEHGLSSLTAHQEEMATRLVESIVCSTPKDNWEITAISCVTNIDKIAELDTMPEVLEVASEHGLTDYPAAILFHSK